MKKSILKIMSLLIIVLLTSSTLYGCNIGKPTQEEAYEIYYDMIQKIVPERMTTPQECDVDFTYHDEIKRWGETFVRDLQGKVASQNIDGKLQCYLSMQWPKSHWNYFYCVNGDNYYGVSAQIERKGTLKTKSLENFNRCFYLCLNTPFFKEEAIKSFTAKRKGADTELTFIVDGANMDDNFAMRVMQEIEANLWDPLDDVKIVLVIGKDGIPKTMSTEMSMTILSDEGEELKSKKISMDFVFNKFSDVDFDLEKEATKYVSNASVLK